MRVLVATKVDGSSGCALVGDVGDGQAGDDGVVRQGQQHQRQRGPKQVGEEIWCVGGDHGQAGQDPGADHHAAGEGAAAEQGDQIGGAGPPGMVHEKDRSQVAQTQAASRPL